MGQRPRASINKAENSSLLSNIARVCKILASGTIGARLKKLRTPASDRIDLDDGDYLQPQVSNLNAAPPRNAPRQKAPQFPIRRP
jgi:hypothetical protein